MDYTEEDTRTGRAYLILCAVSGTLKGKRRSSAKSYTLSNGEMSRTVL